MPLQNRVTPFGDIVATAHRGRFTGNRGIIHDPATRRLLKRRWSSKAWITCVCEFQNRKRNVMATRSWTELFFFDESTSFAAGHRPCFYCRRDDAVLFRDAWRAGNRNKNATAKYIDEILHGERLDHRAKRLHVLTTNPVLLPSGTMIAAGEKSYLIKNGEAWTWSFDGYRRSADRLAGIKLLTPPSTVKAFGAGYVPAFDVNAF